MPRLIIALDSLGSAPRPPFAMDEEVDPCHLEDEHASLQLLERLAWAIADAEEASTRIEMAPKSYLDVNG